MGFNKYFIKNLKETKEKIKKSFGDDLELIQIINSIDELDRIIKILTRRIREWFSWYLPELNEKVHDNKEFVKLIDSKNRQELLDFLEIKEEESMGKQIDSKPLKRLAKLCIDVYALKEKQENDLKQLMEKICPNLLAAAGSVLGAKLIAHAGSIKTLTQMPASKVQLLGAEKALFRHLAKGTKSPKFGYILHHDYVMNAKDKGKAARKLAGKIVIAARVDYF